MLLASHAILRVSSAVKRYSQIKTVSFFSANTRLGTGNQFFFFFFFSTMAPTLLRKYVLTNRNGAATLGHWEKA